MNLIVWVAFWSLALTGVSDTAQSEEAVAEFVYLQPADVTFEQDPATPGLAYAELSGSPEEEGVYVIRLRISPGTKLFRPHFHDQDRFITVISGTWAFGRGDSGKCEDTIPLTAGSYVMHPKGAVHFDGSCGNDTVEVQIIGRGPVKTTRIVAAY